MTTIPEEAVKAAATALANYIGHGMTEKCVDKAKEALTAALPFLPVQGAVKKLEWGNARITEDGREAEDAESPVGRYIATDTGWFLLGRTGYEVERGLYQAKAAAQQDYEARILSALEPSAARELALEEACKLVERRINMVPSDTKAFRAYQDACRHILGDLRALSSPDHADAGKVEGDGWLPIESAPKDGTEILGWHKVAGPAQTRFYDGEWCCVDWNEDQYIACTWEPSHWRPLPSAPASEGAE